MDPLELLELTGHLTDALDKLDAVDQEDALALLDAIEAVQAALEAMGETVQRTDPPVPADEPPAPTTNAVFQSVLDGAEITRELIVQVRAEALKDLSHPQLRPAVKIIRDKVLAMRPAA